MKRVIVPLSAALLLTSTAAFAVDGKTIFDSNGCGACHAADVEKVGPSLKEIAEKYAGKEDRLLSFFKGEEKPIVEPEEFNMMKPNLSRTKALSDDERKALADYILGAK